MPPEDDMSMRRADDRERSLNDRLERLERQQETLRAGVAALENTVNTVKLEQTHMGQLFDVRLKMIERTGDLHTTKLDEVKALVAEIGSDAKGTPAGREMLAEIGSVSKSSDEHGKKLSELDTWRRQAEGAIFLLRWLGWAGVIGLVLTLLRAARALP